MGCHKLFIVISTLFISTKALEILNYSDVQNFVHGSKGNESRVVKREVLSASPIFECYRFTWPGEGFNDTIKCRDNKEYVPCILPYVVADDGTVPVPALVKQYCDSNGCQVTCTPTSSQSCIRYSFYSNNQLTNQSYFCGSAKDLTDNRVITFGEYSQTLKDEHLGEKIGVRVCTGDSLCNSAHNSEILPVAILSVLAVYILVR